MQPRIEKAVFHYTYYQSLSVAVTDLTSMQSFRAKLRILGLVNDGSFSSQNLYNQFSRFVQLPKDSDWLEIVYDTLI